jgi:hypothetical protein
MHGQQNFTRLLMLLLLLLILIYPLAIIDSFPHTLKWYLIYAHAVDLLNLGDSRDRRRQLDAFLPLIFALVQRIAQLQSTLLAFSLGNSETVFCFMLVYSSKTAPRPGCATAGISFRCDLGIFRRQIITLRFYTILYYYYYLVYGVLMNYLNILYTWVRALWIEFKILEF